MIRGNTARAPPKTAAAITAIAAGMLLLAGVLAHVSPDVPDDWPFAAFPAFLGDAFAHVVDLFRITTVGNIADDNLSTRELDGARATDVFQVGGHPFAFVASEIDDGVQILNLTALSNPAAVASIDNDDGVMLDGASDIAVFLHNGARLYAVVASQVDNAVQILDVTGPFIGTPTPIVGVSNVTDDGINSDLHGAVAIDVFDWDSGKRYAAVAAINDGGVQILNLTDPTTHPIPLLDSINHTSTSNLLLTNAIDIKVFDLDNRWYAAVASRADDGVQILNITNQTDITAVSNIRDNGDRLLMHPSSIDVFKHAGNSHVYAVVSSRTEHGVQLLDLTDLPTITPAGRISNSDSDGSTTSRLTSPVTVQHFRSDSHYYIAVGTTSSGIQILNVTDPMHPTAVGSIAPSHLIKIYSTTDIDVLQTGELVATANSDDAIQILELVDGTGINRPPILTMTNQTVTEGDTVMLAPATLRDPDNDPMTYRWSFDRDYYLSRGIVVTLSSNTTRESSFVAPQVSSDIRMEIKLEVRDHHNDDTGDPRHGYVRNQTWITIKNNQPPQFDLGPNLSANESSEVTLTAGTVTDQENDTPFTYRWTFVAYSPADGPTINVSDNASTITFTAPSVTVDTEYAVFLDVTDSRGATNRDEVRLTVLDVPNQPPQFSLDPTRAVDEGKDITFTAGTVTDHENDIPFTYDWRIAVDSPADGPAFSEPDHATDRFTVTAPFVTVDTTYHVFLLVTDNRGAANTQLMVLTVRDVPSPPPTVGAGPDQTVTEGETVTLNGTAYDRDNDPMTFHWSCAPFANSPDIPITIDNPSSGNTTLTAPSTADYSTSFLADDTLAYTCTFTATDIHTSAASDTMTLIVQRDTTDIPVITLNGVHTTKIKSLNDWIDPGAACVSSRDGTALPVTDGGLVQDKKSRNIYKITYSCTFNGETDSVSRKVMVMNGNTIPTISIVSLRDMVGPNDHNTDFGMDANCVDEFDGGLPVTTTTAYHSGNTRATITYTCTDSDNNTVTTTQDVTVASSSPPELHLEGASPYHMTVGDTWADPGAYCTDAEDGRIDEVAAAGTVDTSVQGHYTVSYICTDSDGDMGVGSRNVFVQLPEVDLPPVLTISDDITITVNGTWSLPDATCIDNEDGDISSLVWTWGDDEVDVSKAGAYSVVYFCTDSKDQEVQETLKVVVEEGS